MELIQIQQFLDVSKLEEKVAKKLSKEERRKIREKKKAQAGMPTKMNIYLYFVLIFASIVTFFDGWCTLAITLAMGGFGGDIDILKQFTNPDLFSYFGLSGSPVMMGVILSIAGIGVVAAVSFKYLVDRYGRRPLTIITAVAFTTFSVLTAFVPSGAEGLLPFLILRICANYFLSADIVTIIMAEESPDHLRGRLIGSILAMNTVGGMACGIVQMFGIQLTIFGRVLSTWQSLFFLTSIGYLFIIPLFFFLKETNRFKAMRKYEDWRKKKGLKPKTGWFKPLQKKYIRGMSLGCVVGFLAQLIYFAQVTYFGLYFAKEQNLTSEAVGVLSIPLMVAAGIGYFSAGPLMDRWGRLPCVHRFGCIVVIGGAFFSWPTALIAGNVTTPLLTGLVVAGGMIGIFGLTILNTVGAVVPLEMFPTHIVSTAMGWIGAIARGAMVLAPFLMMFGAEAEGGLGLTYHFMFILMELVLATIMFSAYLLAPESKGRRLEEIVVTEIYGKMKRPEKKKYREPYYFYLLGLATFIIGTFLYSWSTGSTLMNALSMIGFYSALSIGCFLIIIYVRNYITTTE